MKNVAYDEFVTAVDECIAEGGSITKVVTLDGQNGIDTEPGLCVDGMYFGNGNNGDSIVLTFTNGGELTLSNWDNIDVDEDGWYKFYFGRSSCAIIIDAA